MKISNSQIFWEALGFIAQICIGIYDLQLLATLHVFLSCFFLGYLLDGKDMPLNVMITYMGVIFVIGMMIVGVAQLLSKYIIVPFNKWLDKFSFKRNKINNNDND